MEEMTENIPHYSDSDDKIKIKVFLREIIEFVKREKPSKSDIAKHKISLCRKLGMKRIPTDIELFLNADTEDIGVLKEFIHTKPMRTGSGVAVIAVMSKPGRCPHGKCIYCPGGLGSSFGDVPQSYTGNEPATMRGIRNNYDSYLQVMSRLEQYIAIGQSPEKAEIIVLGGTFISFSDEYKESFIRDIYAALNDFSDMFYEEEIFNLKKFKEFFELPGDIKNKKRTESIQKKLLDIKSKNKRCLDEEKRNNENSNIKCVGLTLETKPDWGFAEHGNKMLEYGCTRIELGIQTLSDKILSGINRGHTIDDAKRSIRELKDLGFKLNFHMMPGLPGSSKENDVNELRDLFNNPDFRPDMLKIYPTMVMPGTILEDMMIRKEYSPYEIDEAVEILSEGLNYVPEYCRVMRIQRDIPAKFAISAIDKNNLRQIVSSKMKEKGYSEKDIRAREIKDEEVALPVKLKNLIYDSSGGTEYFISYVDSKDRLLGFVRMRFPSQSLRKEITEDSAIVRELHVYGRAAQLKGEKTNAQHRGYGGKLLAEAEKMAAENKKSKILVISGVGVRDYYKKKGYSHDGPYMSKSLI